MNMQQETLWPQDPPRVQHHLIEVGYQGGKRMLTCSVGTDDKDLPSEGQIYAGFVNGDGGPCPVCTKRKDFRW